MICRRGSSIPTDFGLGISFCQSNWLTPVAFGQVRSHEMSVRSLSISLV